MKKKTQQMEHWAGDFGKKYTDRNALSPEELDALHERIYGITRTELNERFLEGMHHSIRILEVGSNVGDQLACLQRMGFRDLSGIELQNHAVKLANSRTERISVIEGSAFDIPFGDAYFNLVFTSGLLIHIAPDDLALAMQEIHRCTRKYIWGFEYYADKCQEVTYRGHAELLWKADYARLYLDQFEDLRLVKEERIGYLDSDDVDTMFLLRKR